MPNDPVSAAATGLPATRRTILASLFAWPFSAAPTPASPAVETVDPVLVALDRYGAARAAHLLAIEEVTRLEFLPKGTALDAAEAALTRAAFALGDAEWSVLTTIPSTRAGAAHLAAFGAQMAEENCEEGLPEAFRTLFDFIVRGEG